MAKALSLRDEVASAIPSRARRKWEDDLDPAVVAELEEIRADWASGKLGAGVTRTGIAKAIARTLNGRGIAVSANTVFRWLDR